MIRAASLALAVLTTTASAATERVVTSARQLVDAATAAAPGDTIVLDGGPFSGVQIGDLEGSGAAPITIRGRSAGAPAKFRGGNTGIQLSGCRHVTLRFLDVRGAKFNGINIDDGGDKTEPSRGIIVEDCTVEEIGPRGNFDGLKMSGVDDFSVRRCQFRGWGGSAIDMVGCHDGVVAGCTFSGADGFSQMSGIQMKGGTARIKVVRNHFEQAGQRALNIGGSTGLAYFRPAVGKYEAEDIEVAGNTFVGGMAPLAWVTSRNGHVHHNTFYLPEKWVGRILQENAEHGFEPAQRGIFEHNLIVFDHRVRTFINVGGGTAAETFVFRNNAWFETGGDRRPQLPVQESGSVYGIDPELANAGSADMVARSGNPSLADKGADAFQPDR